MPSIRARLTNAFLRMTAKSLWKPGVDLGHLRQHVERVDRRMGRPTRAFAMQPADIPGVNATWVGEPALEARGTLLYLHGGAWVVHLPATYLRLAGELSALTGMRVLLVDYRLAPEHPFPAAIDDCLAAYRWLIDNHYAQRPLALAGDSAGGNLSLITLMRARDAGLKLPDCTVLISPATDITFSGPSVQYNADADVMFTLGAGDLLPDLYCPGQLRTNPLISPLFGDWAGLPPLLFHAGSTEMLLDDSVRAHDRANQAGTPAEIKVFIDLPHVFHVIRWLPEAREALREVAEFIVKHARERAHTQSLPLAPLTVTAEPDFARAPGAAL
jgi:monoterpene epsilon-lactone hydrolase